MKWTDALTDAWDDLTKILPVARQYRSRLLSTDTPLDISAGIRAIDNAPCLMLKTLPSPDALFELGGMRLNMVPDASGTFLVLSLEDASRLDLFTTICADLIAAASAAGHDDALGQFLARLRAWRHFLRDRHDGLSRAETVGLIGELLVLEQLLTRDPGTLKLWEAPNDGLHDLLHVGHAIEVKTALGPSTTIHISRLDQLDTAGVNRLDLLHVRLIEDADGRSMGDIIAAIGALLAGTTHVFNNLLLQRGLLPDDTTARGAPKVRLRSIDAYLVTDDFPRLLRSTLPTAITEASYVLEVRALQAFSLQTSDVLDTFFRRGHS